MKTESGLQEDKALLHRLGYAQELRRTMGTFSNFAVSFTIISILSGCMTLYGYAMSTGGPVEMSLAWPFVGLLVVCVGLAMAEVCSTYPTSGGLYYWAARMAGPKTAPVWSWYTGWFNLIGQFGITAGIDFGLAQFVLAFLNIHFGAPVTPINTIVVYGLVLLAHGLLNTYGIRLVALLNDISAWWHMIGVLIIALVLVFVPAHHQSAAFVFTSTYNGTGFGFLPYVLLIGFLMAQYTYTGYDASAHMSEETHRAQISAPRGIVWSIVISVIAGWVLLLAVTFAIQNYKAEMNSATGVPPFQIFIDAIGGKLATLLELIVIGAQFWCGMASVTANSRMIYAFSRDGAVPGSRFWHHINPRTRTPTNSVWLAAVAAFILGLPYLWSATAYGAVTSIAVIGLYIAYVIPVYLRLRQGSAFSPGPWSLGRWSRPIGIISVAWVVLITILFVLPQSSPVTATTFNYAPAAVGVVLLFAWAYWQVSAKHWFHGPKVQGTEEELLEIEKDLDQAGGASVPSVA